MKTPKESFLDKKELSDWLRGIVGTAQFSECLNYVKAEMFGLNGVTAEMIRGAVEFERILKSISDIESEPVHFDSGINHDIGNPQPKKPDSQ